MVQDLSTGSLSSCHELRLQNHSASGESDIEEYSLTYLKYKQYFTSAPLARCLDQGSQSTRQSTPHALEVEKNSLDRVANGSGDDDVKIEIESPSAEFQFFERDPVEARAF
jgi:hypothetical protein